MPDRGEEVANGPPTRWVGESGVMRSGFSSSRRTSSRSIVSYCASEISG